MDKHKRPKQINLIEMQQRTLKQGLPQRMGLSFHERLHNYVKPFLEKSRKSVCITNDIYKTGITNVYYVRITQKMIDFRLKTKTRKELYHYQLDTGIFTLNDVETSDDFLKQFMTYLHQTAKDIKARKAMVFVEKH